MGAVLEGMFVKASTLPGGVDCCSDDPEYCEQSAYGVIQVLGLAAVYAGVLSHGSRLISDGAELLQVVPSLQHLVGSIVLPVLGTVPDCAIILFSGLGGDRAEAQEQISVGVGALAGSTTLLLTLPWAMSVYLGRVDHSATTGRPQYRRPANWRTAEHGKWHKLQQTHALRGLTTTGVTCGAAVRSSTLALGCSSLLYVMIQAPAMTRSFRTIDAPVSDEDAMAVAAFERPFAIAALVVSLAAFVGYLASKVASADHDPVLTFRAEEMRIALIKSGHLTLVGAMEHLVEKLDRLDSAGAGSALVAVSSTAAVANGGSSAKAKEGALRTPLAPREASSAASALGGGDGRASARARARWSLLRGLGASACVEHEEVMEELRYTLRPFFQRYDVDGSHTIDGTELPLLFADLHEKLGPQEMAAFQQASHETRRGSAAAAGGGGGGGGSRTGAGATLLEGEVELTFDQFVSVVINYIRRRGAALSKGEHRRKYREVEAGLVGGEGRASVPAELEARTPAAEGEEEDDDDDEEDGEEMPDELRDLPPAEQYRRATATAAKSLLGGTALVVLFSEPMVGVLSEIARRSGVAPFYVAFVLAPIASNGAEVLSALAFSRRKTVRSTTISFSTLLGSVIMNNTFCLAVFMALIVARGDLYWEFTAETVSILMVELAMLYFGLRKDQRLLDGVFVGLLYPLGLALVVGLEAIGID